MHLVPSPRSMDALIATRAIVPLSIPSVTVAILSIIIFYGSRRIVAEGHKSSSNLPWSVCSILCLAQSSAAGIAYVRGRTHATGAWKNMTGSLENVEDSVNDYNSLMWFIQASKQVPLDSCNLTRGMWFLKYPESGKCDVPLSSRLTLVPFIYHKQRKSSW